MQLKIVDESQWVLFFEFCENEFYKPEVRFEYEQWHREQICNNFRKK